MVDNDKPTRKSRSEIIIFVNVLIFTKVNYVKLCVKENSGFKYAGFSDRESGYYDNNKRVRVRQNYRTRGVCVGYTCWKPNSLFPINIHGARAITFPASSFQSQ